MATRLSQYHANFLGDPVAGMNLGKSSKQNGLPRRASPPDRKFLENGLEPVGDITMSLLRR